MPKLKPTRRSAWYEFEVGLWRIDDEGHTDEEIVKVPKPTTGSLVKNYSGDVLGNLVWASFYRSASVIIDHYPVKLVPKEVSEVQEVLRGRKLRAAEDSFVVDRGDDDITFATASEVLAARELSPHM